MLGWERTQFEQRAVMALSTLLNPSLLTADEITSALDVSTQKAVAERLTEFLLWPASIIRRLHTGV
jgi:ABC-type dipeptide/oligopeptide/nickel transport system ATPase component